MSSQEQDPNEQKISTFKRLKLWMIYLVISFVVMAASIESKADTGDSNNEYDSDKRGANRKWCIAASAVTFATTIIILGVHFLSNFPIIGGKVEGLSIFVSVVFWVVIVVVASEPNTGVAIDAVTGSVTNGNIYYFSWGGFLTSIVLFFSYLKDTINVYVSNELAASRFKWWATLLASSIVVIGSSASKFDRECTASDKNTTLCSRTILGLVLGIVGTLLSLAFVAMTISGGRVSFMVESGAGLLLFILNAFGVAFITSDKGPGAPLGNLYYFSWLSFILSFFVLSGCYEDYQTAKNTTEDEEIGDQNLDINAAENELEMQKEET